MPDPRHRVVTWPLAVEPYFQRLPGCHGLLHAIAEEPEDNTLRLILADWLDDHDEYDRAEFIRLQVRLRCLPEWSHERQTLRARQEALLRQNGERWTIVDPENWTTSRTPLAGCLIVVDQGERE